MEFQMAKHGKILITGATGTTGTGLVEKLLHAGADVRALVRNPQKAAELRSAGAEVVIGNLDEPETITPAMDGIEKLYLLTWNGPTARQQAEHFLNIARRIGNIHIVRHSMWGPENSRIIKEGYQIEADVESSGLPWTLIKPTFFMQNTKMAAQTIASHGTIYWDMIDGKLAMIDARDIVDVAFEVLTGSGHEGKSYILTGPQAISFDEVAASFSRVLGKEIKYVNVPGNVAFNAMTGMGVPEWIASGYVELSEGFSKNFAEEVSECVPMLTGHPARTFDEFVRDFASTFKAAISDKAA
jgi:uncharacterized protein YbjT (DUF2867 family)